MKFKIEETSKEKQSLTRKLVVYRNWRRKKERNKVLGKENEAKNQHLALLCWFCYISTLLNIGFLGCLLVTSGSPPSVNALVLNVAINIRSVFLSPCIIPIIMQI